MPVDITFHTPQKSKMEILFMSIEVSVVRVPGRKQIAVVEEGATVADVLSAVADTLGSGEVVKFTNGTEASLDSTVNNYDTIVVSKGAKGNA